METMELLKGLHPGAYLTSELQKRKIRPGQMALSIGEYPQTLNAIMKGRRAMNTSLSLKLEQALGLSEGFLMTLQVFHDIKKEKETLHKKFQPDLSKFRKSLFWDTRLENIDWIAQKKAVIERIMQRGNTQEQEEIKRFYESVELNLMQQMSIK
jgi:antitoxin HigA-1